jgi:large subunit ribosomal protein L6e
LFYNSIGPYNVNGVPLRRVNQRYVIATSTKVSVDGVDVSNIDDAFFAREKKTVKKGEEALFDQAKKPTVTSEARKSAQAAVDAKLSANIERVELLKAFLGARFRLRNSDKPHAMKF